MEQAKQIMDQQGYSGDEVDFFVAINMMYSDYCKVAKRNNCGTTEFYAAMAKAFLDDKDAQPENYPGIRNILQVTNAIKPSIKEGFILLLGGTIYYFLISFFIVLRGGDMSSGQNSLARNAFHP